ncbi:MAG: nicotinate (nicotinamide) nucleotide adenylyltransferase [Candidatus Marinimicrobia bacterium]|nr:nicotinate (nicotinamide) nucleotide adenylyltransferase [Candidatus Neomarinimicrobiota bacterium]MBL7022648.1 nicotinate (nicotinamide) nucleotide adenylyltransferase [Candidatus Neomarinimicrobiota bacterium]
MKIYFLGGSFDPPHLGHLGIAEYCIPHCDKFLFIPAKQSPHKENIPFASNNDRIAMLDIMSKSNPKIEIDTFEIESNSTNYTLHTVEHLEEKYPQSELTMVIGLDQLKRIKEWYKINSLLKRVKVICFNRDGIEKNNLDKVEIIPDFKIVVSSTEIRKLLAQNNTKVHKYLDNKVYNFIKRKQLYL